MSAQVLEKLVSDLNKRLTDLETQIQEAKEKQKAAMAEMAGHRLTLNSIEELARGEEASKQSQPETQGQAERYDSGVAVLD